MIPSSLELNSDDFPFFGDLKRTSGSRKKLEKSPFENRDNHHWPGGSEMSRWWWWWWWWWLEKIRKTKIQTQRQIQRQIHTHKYRKIPNTQSQKDRGRFDTRGSPVALLVPKISVEITFTLYSLIDLSGSRWPCEIALLPSYSRKGRHARFVCCCYLW